MAFPVRRFMPLLLLGLIGLSTACTSSDRGSTEVFYALMAAIDADDSAAVAEALANGAPRNAADSTGSTPLTRAATQGNMQIVQALVEAGADVNQPDRATYQATALMVATTNNSVDIAQYLIANGADVDAVDAFGDSALNWAAYYGWVGYVRVLLEVGANAHQPSQHSENTMGVALKEWQPEVVRLLIENGEGQILAPQVQTLVNAVRAHDAEQVTIALAAGASPNQRDEAGTPILILAAEQGHTALVKQLLAAGADINALNAVGQTALTQAAYYGQHAIVDYLLQNNADVNQTDERYQLTALMAAARAGHSRLVKQLLENGANLEAVDGINRFTSILWSTLHNHPETVRVLKEAGASLSHRSAYDFTAIDIASDSIRVILEDRMP